MMKDTNSLIIIGDNPPVPLSSFTAEERAAIWERMAERIGKAVEDYIYQHPERYEAVKAALLSVPGAELISEEPV